MAARSKAREQQMEEKLKHLAVAVKVERDSQSEVVQNSVCIFTILSPIFGISACYLSSLLSSPPSPFSFFF